MAEVVGRHDGGSQFRRDAAFGELFGRAHSVTLACIRTPVPTFAVAPRTWRVVARG